MAGEFSDMDTAARLESRIRGEAGARLEALRRDMWEATALVLARHGLATARDPGGHELTLAALRLYAPGEAQDAARDTLRECFMVAMRERIADALFETLQS